MLVIVHLEVFEVGFGLAFRIVGSEVVFELSDKVGVVVEPGQTFARGQRRIEPI